MSVRKVPFACPECGLEATYVFAHSAGKNMVQLKDGADHALKCRVRPLPPWGRCPVFLAEQERIGRRADRVS